MRRPLARGSASKVSKKNRCGLIEPTPSLAQAPHQLAAQPSAADRHNELLARACLSPSAVPGVDYGVSWLFYRDRTTGLLAVRAISAEELQRGPFPECRGRA